MWLCLDTAEKLWLQQHKVCLSGDAGRFLCNFIYFKSLEQAHAHAPAEPPQAVVPDRAVPQSGAHQRGTEHMQRGVRWHSLFVHVPPFEVIGKEEQLSFLADLLEQLSVAPELHVPPSSGTAPAVQLQLPGWSKPFKALS